MSIISGLKVNQPLSFYTSYFPPSTLKQSSKIQNQSRVYNFSNKSKPRKTSNDQQINYVFIYKEDANQIISSRIPLGMGSVLSVEDDL